MSERMHMEDAPSWGYHGWRIMSDEQPEYEAARVPVYASDTANPNLVYTDPRNIRQMERGRLMARAPELAEENAALRAERDELLAALTGVLDTVDPIQGDDMYAAFCAACDLNVPENATNDDNSWHAANCPWRIAVELRDRLAARGKEDERA